MTNLLKRERTRFLVEEMTLQMHQSPDTTALTPETASIMVSGSFEVSQQPAEAPTTQPGSPAALSLDCYRGLPSLQTIRKLVENAMLSKVYFIQLLDPSRTSGLSRQD